MKVTVSFFISLVFPLFATSVLVASELPTPTPTVSPSPSASPTASPTPDEVVAEEIRPNIIVFVSDDQHWWDMQEEVMPKTFERIMNTGMTFTNAYVTTPWCCPSRASIFTGKYANKHGVVGNTFPLHGETVINALQDAGYFTGIVGKYLNSWKGKYREEFDFWRVFPGGNTSYKRPTFYENQVRTSHREHIAQVMNRYVQEFLVAAEASGKPYLLFVTPNIPHRPALPERRYRDLVFVNVAEYKPNNNRCRFRRGKPRWMRNAPNCGFKRDKKNGKPPKDDFQIRQRRSLKSFDDIIGDTVDQVEAQGDLPTTALFYISDNGLLRGSFKLRGKPFAYEDAIYVPFGMSYPPLVMDPQESSALVANIDIAPTIYELAGIAIPEDVDGTSLLPLLKGEVTSVREDLLFEGYFTQKVDNLRRSSFAGLKTNTYTLIINQLDRAELYNMSLDPLQKRNRIVAEKEKAQELFSRLLEYRPDISGDDWLTKRYQDLLIE